MMTFIDKLSVPFDLDEPLFIKEDLIGSQVKLVKIVREGSAEAVDRCNQQADQSVGIRAIWVDGGRD